MINKIINFISNNKISTTEVADCLDKSGGLVGPMPINRGHFSVGKVRWTFANEFSNWNVHKDIQEVDESEIVLIDVFDCEDRAIVGELVAKYLLLYKKACALICCGNVRDASAFIQNDYSVWCSGFNPVGCHNEKPKTWPTETVIDSKRKYYDGAIAVCDDTGVVIIPKEKHTEEFLSRLHNMKNQEEIWFDRLNRFRESTFDIVCNKYYLNEKD